MASSTADYNPRLIRDSRLNDVSSSIDYAVSQGAAQNSYQVYNANTSSGSNISFNVTPPSESVVLDREVLLRATVKFVITITSTQDFGATFLGLAYGNRDGFKSFPLSSLFNTCTATINNTSVSINLQDVLPTMLRQYDMEDLAYYEGMTPIALDKYKYYSDALLKNNNPLGSFDNSSHNNHWLPRGCHPLDKVTIKQFQADGTTANGTDNLRNANGLTRKYVINVEATFTEPLFISPFILHSKYNQAGLLGVNNINLNFNIGSMSQFWATGLGTPVNGGAVTYEVALDQAKPFDAKLLLNYLSVQTTSLLPARNIVPFWDISRYITAKTNTAEVKAGEALPYTLNSIQLNQIPDKIFVIARKEMSSQTVRDSSTFLTIQKVSINFNNASGLLSSAEQQHLWRMSVANNSKQSWYDFYGKYGWLSGGDAAVAGATIYSEGSILVIDPARDLSLPSYLSNGSIGQFSLQMNVTVFNNTLADMNPEFVVIVVNSGLFATIAGSSVVRTGLLNMDIVSQLASTSQDSAVSSSDYKELSGGSLGDQVASALKNIPLKGRGGPRSGGLAPKSKLDMVSY